MSPRLEYRFRRVLMIAAIGFAGAAIAGEEAPHRQSTAQTAGVARMTIAADGAQVLVELAGPAATLVGFEDSPKTADERETLRLAKENLQAGDGMIRFNTNADCQLIDAKVNRHLAGHQSTEITVSYRFDCARPDRLDSAALGLFIGFPALQRVLVHYVTKDGRGGAELTPNHPVVTFVPLS